MRKSIFLLVLAVLSLTSCSGLLSVEDEDSFKKGEGNQENPYVISNAKELNLMRNYVGSSNSDVYFVLNSDINIDNFSPDEGWIPVGDNETSFHGNLDGNGFTIKNVHINRSGQSHVGFFGCFRGTVKNLTLENVTLENGQDRVGALAGRNRGVIEGCHVSGSVQAIGEYVGGLVGHSRGVVNNSSFEGSVKGNDYVGGLIGRNLGELVERSFANASVEGRDRVGGFIGRCTGDLVRINFSTGNVEGRDGVGGFMGINESSATKEKLLDNYSTASVDARAGAGGFIGINMGLIKRGFSSGVVISREEPYGGFCAVNTEHDIADNAIVENSYYNSETSGMSDTNNATPLTSSQITDISNFEGWNFSLIWSMPEEASHPLLKWQLN